MVLSTGDQKLNIRKNIIRGLWPKPMHKGRDFQGKKIMCYKQFSNDYALKTNLNFNSNCSFVVWERSHEIIPL